MVTCIFRFHCFSCIVLQEVQPLTPHSHWWVYYLDSKKLLLLYVNVMSLHLRGLMQWCNGCYFSTGIHPSHLLTLVLCIWCSMSSTTLQSDVNHPIWCWIYQSKSATLSTLVLHLCMLIVFKYILERKPGSGWATFNGVKVLLLLHFVTSFSHKNPFMSVGSLIFTSSPWCLPNSLFQQPTLSPQCLNIYRVFSDSIHVRSLILPNPLYW